MDPYAEAHIFVAAIRILQHRNEVPPSVEEVCTMIEISVESGYSICRKLEKEGIVDILEDPFSVKVTVADYLAIEKLSRDVGKENSITQELEKFKAKKEEASQKIDVIKAQMEKKKKDRLSDIESKFKEEMEKYKER